MLLLTLTLLLSQVPTSPQVLVSGSRYEADLVEPLRGHEAVEICDGRATATTLTLRGRRSEPYRTLTGTECDSIVVFVGTVLMPGDRIPVAKLGLDPETGETLVSLGIEPPLRLRWTPYSDGGVRGTLLFPDGFEHVLFESPAPAASADVLWAGDLNGDGHTDWVLEATEGFTRFQQLLLSDEDGVPRLTSETVTAGDRP